MACKAKSCRYWKKCLAKRECMDFRCNDYERDPNFTPSYESVGPRMTPYERTRAQVYATGNKWAIENFHATHD